MKKPWHHHFSFHSDVISSQWHVQSYCWGVLSLQNVKCDTERRDIFIIYSPHRKKMSFFISKKRSSSYRSYHKLFDETRTNSFFSRLQRRVLQILSIPIKITNFCEEERGKSILDVFNVFSCCQRYCLVTFSLLGLPAKRWINCEYKTYQRRFADYRKTLATQGIVKHILTLFSFK